MTYAYDSDFQNVLTAPRPQPEMRLPGIHGIVVKSWRPQSKAQSTSGLKWITGTPTSTTNASATTTSCIFYVGSGGGWAYTTTERSKTIVGSRVIVPTIKAFESDDPLIKELTLSGSMATSITSISNGDDFDIPSRGPLAGYEAYAHSNWDGYDAEPISPETLRAARFFLSMLPETLGEPDIAPGADGTIGLEWSFTDRPLRKLFIDIGPGAVWGGYWRRANGETQTIPATPIIFDTVRALKELFDKLSA